MKGKAWRRDDEKERFWRRVIGEAARSGMSIREFCRVRKLEESQFYWWRRVIEERRGEGALPRHGKGFAARGGAPASFVLVGDSGNAVEAGIELVLGDGCRVRIGKGVDEGTLRTVLSALGRERC